jgi:hypothetical protein
MGVLVAVGLGVLVGGVSVGVAVAVGVAVLVDVAVLVGVVLAPLVGVAVAVVVAVTVAMLVAVPVDVLVGVAVAVLLGVVVGVSVLVTAAAAVTPRFTRDVMIRSGPAAGVLVEVGVGLGLATVDRNGANKVKCVVVPVTVFAAELTLEGSPCQVVPSQKKTPVGGRPVYASVTSTGCLKTGTLPLLTMAAVRSTAPPASSCPVGAGGAPARATRMVVFCSTVPGGKTTRALPSGSATDPPPGPTTASATSGLVGVAVGPGPRVDVGTGVAVGPFVAVGDVMSGANAGPLAGRGTARGAALGAGVAPV